jgi:hypothetical protein
MNELEWRRQMRDLRQPLMPQRDLWAGIDAALDDNRPARLSPPANATAPIPKHRQRWLIAGSLAASLLLAAGLGWHLLQTPTATPVARANPAPTTWKPDDPRLAGAAIELDAARMELQLAIQQSPDSPALRRLLDRTEQQQTQLRQLAKQAG